MFSAVFKKGFRNIIENKNYFNTLIYQLLSLLRSDGSNSIEIYSD